MANENRPPQSVPPFGPTQYKWIPARNGVNQEIYGNFVHPSWTLFDVRLRVGQLIPDEASKTFVVEERAAVTFAWPQAKVLRDMFARLVDAYEEANGEIEPLKLPPDKSVITSGLDDSGGPKAEAPEPSKRHKRAISFEDV